MFGGSKKPVDVVSQFTGLSGGGEVMNITHLPALADSLQISADDVVMYILPWKLAAKVPLQISLAEWTDGLRAMRIDSIDKLRQGLPNLRSEIRTANGFKMFYYFVFDWIRETETAKFVSNEAACDVWELIFPAGGKSFPLLSKWVEFIRNVYKKNISKDLWRQTHDFAQVTGDLSKYDSNAAWPTAMDEFVEWMKENSKN